MIATSVRRPADERWHPPTSGAASDRGAAPLRDVSALPAARTGYRPARPARGVVGALVAVPTGLVLLAFATMGVRSTRERVVSPLVVALLPIDRPEPEPKAALPTEPRTKRLAHVPEPQPVVAPPPLVRTPALAPSVATVPVPPPPAPPQAAPAPTPAPRGPVDIDDLGAKLLSATPPRYPVDSRRRHEEGTVVLMVVVGEDGRVETVAVESSSGSERLDSAARTAVQRWRWTPTLRDGVAVRVRGSVRIPFHLT